MQIKDLLADYINKAPGKKLTDIMRDLPFTEDNTTYFKFSGFWRYLQRSKSWTLQKQKTLRLLRKYSEFRTDVRIAWAKISDLSSLTR